MSTPIAQLPGISQHMPATTSTGPPPALTREQLNSLPSPQQQQSAMAMQQPQEALQDPDDATIQEVFNHIAGNEGPRRAPAQQHQQQHLQQDSGEQDPDADELLYYDQQQQYALPPQQPASTTGGWLQSLWGCGASRVSLDLQMLVFIACMVFAASMLPVGGLLSRYLPIAARVPNAELGLKALVAAAALVAIKRWNDVEDS